MVLPSLEQVIETRKSLGYPVFEGAYNINLGGMRSENSISNNFDDWLYMFYQDHKGGWEYLTVKGTTDPGKHWLNNPMNNKGTIIMVPTHHEQCYELDYHHKYNKNKRYPAFRQIDNMSYVRDNNKDSKLDFDLYRDPEKAKIEIFKDICFTNLHRAHAVYRVGYVGGYSAGCQVAQDVDKYHMFLDSARRSQHGSKFSYTLFEERDLV